MLCFDTSYAVIVFRLKCLFLTLNIGVGGAKQYHTKMYRKVQ